MTFLEAAIEVLKREGKPLDTGRLADLAVRHNLLSVVGRDPASTMEERIQDALEKRDPKLLLFEVKKGVYGLRVYPERPYPSTGAATKAARPAEAKPTNGEPEGEAAHAEGANGDGEKKRRRRGRRG